MPEVRPEAVRHASRRPYQERVGRLRSGVWDVRRARADVRVPQARPALDRERGRRAQREPDHDAGGDAGHAADAHPSDPIEAAIATNSGSSRPGASSEWYTPERIHSSSERSGVYRPWASPMFTADCIAE